MSISKPLRRYARHALSARTRRKVEITDYFENTCHFRDYSFVSARQWGTLSVRASINLLKPTDAELADALDVFVRDGFSTIIIYL